MMIQSNGFEQAADTNNQTNTWSSQKWSFPMNTYTAYSSSNNSICEAENLVTSQNPSTPISISSHSSKLAEQTLSNVVNSSPPIHQTLANQQNGISMQVHDGEWSLNLNRPKKAIDNDSRTSRIQVSAQVYSESSLSNGLLKESTSSSGQLTNQQINQEEHSFLIAKNDESPLQNDLQDPEIVKIRENDYDSDTDTDQLLTRQYRTDKAVDIPELKNQYQRHFGREVSVRHPDFPDRLIEGFLYPSRYLGSTQLVCDNQPTKFRRLRQAQEAVNRIKAPEGENQPSVPVELFICSERVLILNKELEEILMDHSLRLISYIADIGNILVLITRRCQAQSSTDGSSVSVNTDSVSLSNATTTSLEALDEPSALSNFSDKLKPKQPSKVICHLFESEKVQIIAQAIGKAFQESYFEYLKEHGIDDPVAYQEHDYQNVLNQQEIYRNDLELFADRDKQKEVIIPKLKGEQLGVVIVESGWGSVLPTAVLANMHPEGPSARCGQLNIGNQIISINGQSLVGLPLQKCQSFIKATKQQTAVKLIVINCTPVVEVLIRRPDLKYQLGFSVQDGVICSLLRGGIAERGGIRVDHRIIEVNGESMVAVPHDRIVHILATSVGEIYIRTMPTSIFRLLTGQDVPHYI